MRNKLFENQLNELLNLLEIRFNQNMNRHIDLSWENIRYRLLEKEQKLWSLYEMERTGGEPDVIGYNSENDEYIFVDCSLESPIGRRSICYDDEALESRKKDKPENSAVGMAMRMGIELLTEEEYKKLQSLGQFDTKTSSWIKTPHEIRNLKGALFCDCRYNTVFTYHNGAESYYSARGFRGILKI